MSRGLTAPAAVSVIGLALVAAAGACGADHSTTRTTLDVGDGAPFDISRTMSTRPA